MSQLQLTQIALVGARMDSFAPLGFNSRHELAMRRVAPGHGQSYAGLPAEALRSTLRRELPLWVHNIITDEEFPRREALMMPLRRFEGELLDQKQDEVVSMVLSHGFRNETFDPERLPDTMGVKERCAVLAHVQVWKQAYAELESGVLDILSDCSQQLDRWVEMASQAEHSLVE